MSASMMTRRQALKSLLALGVGAAALAACGATPTPQVVEKVVEKEVTKIVEGTPQVVKETSVVEKIVTPTPGPAQPITIVATSQMGVETWDGSIKRAQERFPNITLKVDQTSMPGGWSGYADLVVTRLAGGEQLDLVMIAIEGLPLLSVKKAIRPLDSSIEADTQAKKMLTDDTHPLLRKMLMWEGKQMEFPFSWNNMVMYYNTAIFKQKNVDPPAKNWTWDDFLQTSLKIADVKGTAEDLYAYSFWGAGMFGMCAWYFVNDASPLTKDWRDSNMLDPKVQETLQFLADLIRKNKVAPNPTGWNETGQFHAGHLAMRTCGRWCIGASLQENFTTYDLQYQPHRAGALRTVAGTDGWGMTTLCAHPKEAWDILMLLSGPEASMDMVKLGGNIPTLRSVAETPEFQKYGPPNTAIFYESLDYADMVVAPPNFNIIEPLLDRHYAGIWNGDVSVEEACAAAHKELQAEMDKLKTQMGDTPFKPG